MGSLAVGASELHTAARAGDVERVRALLKEGVPVSSPDTLGGTALHDAAWSGHVNVVLVLLAVFVGENFVANRFYDAEPPAA